MSITKNLSAKIGIEVSEKSTWPPLTEKDPFPIRSLQGRKYVRIEVTSPVDFRLLIPKRGRLSLAKDQCSGKILNLSCGGLLLESRKTIPEGAFLLLSLNLNGLVILEGVLGKTKRLESTEDGEYLVGVEFCLREELENFASKEEIEKLPVKVGSFNHKLKKIILSYVGTAHLAMPDVKTVF
ncbi:MAG: PilZ domain-containing protein [candidate division Zixibacteria bacterium]|nr:PilZ domain-containing protein [candidate division Zixibacteria bacterium]